MKKRPSAPSAFAIISFVVFQFTGRDGDSSGTEMEEEDYKISCSLEDGYLYTYVTGFDIPEWKYQAMDSYGTVLKDEYTDAGGYHSSVAADFDVDDGTYRVVTAAFDKFGSSTDPIYYSVATVTIEDNEIVEASDPVIVDDLSE